MLQIYENIIAGKEVAFTILGSYRITESKVIDGWFQFDTLGLIG